MDYLKSLFLGNINQQIWVKFKGDQSPLISVQIVKVSGDCVLFKQFAEKEQIIVPIANISYIKVNFDN